MPRILLAVAIVLALFMSGCKIGGHNSSNSQANLRLLNLAALTGNVNSVNMSINTTQELSGVTFETLTSYASYDSGSADTIQISLSDNSAILSNSTFTFNSGTNYTLVVYGSNSQPGTLLIEDDTSLSLNSGNFEIRPAHTAINVAGMDFYVLPLGTSFQSSGATFPGFTLTGIPLFQQFTAGTYVLYAAQSNSKTIIYQSEPIAFATGDVITVDLFSVGSGTLVDAYGMNQATSSTQVGLYPNLVSQIKAVNAAPTSGTVNVQYDGLTIFSSIPFTGVTTYAQVPSAYADTHAVSAVTSTLAYFPANSLTPIVPVLNPTLAGGGDYSSILVGNPASSILLLEDNNLAPSTGDAKMRFVNVSPDAGPINVQLAFASVVQGLPINTASNYFNFPQNTLPGYTVTAQLVSTGANALTVNGVELTAGGTYTLYIMGPAASLQGILSRDN